MANTLTAVTDKILAAGVMALRQMSIMALLVNRGYESSAGQSGTTIDVPIPSAVATQDVAPGPTPPATADIAPTSVSVPLDQWKEAPFYLTDKDELEAVEGVFPMQASEALKSLVNTVDNYILTTLYRDIYGFTGTPGTTPFATDTSDVTNIRVVLNKQLSPMDNRRIVVNPDAEGKALNLRAFNDMSWNTGNTQALIDGNLTRKFGFDFFMDQNVDTGAFHTSTVFTAGAATANGVNALASTTLSIAKATNTSPLVKGDIITIAGDPQTYVVVTGVTLAVGNTNVTISPGLKKATVGAEAISLKASHVVNLGFHRDCFAFASRPLRNTREGLGSIMQTAIDPISKLALRLEVRGEHKRVRYSWDMLYGGKVVRPELGCRLAG